MSQAPKAIVRALTPTGEARPPSRFIPAGFASVTFHAGLLVLLLLVSSSGQADIPLEAVKLPDIISTDTQEHDPARDDPLLATVRNDGSLERDRNPNYDHPVKGEVSLPGQFNPLDNAGLNGGMQDGLLQDLGPPKGFTSQRGPGAGGGLDSLEGVINVCGPSVFWGGKNPDYFKALRGSATTREQLVRTGGGTNASEAAVARGLQWLAANQAGDGSWRLDGAFPDKGTQNDVAGTAFGLLPLLAAGKTHKAAKDNPYDKPIEKALLYLIGKQDKRTGNLGGGMYGHGLAAIALCEAYGMTQDPALRRPTQMAINYIVSAQHDGGGWRYAPNQVGDTSVSGWHIMALKSAQMAGLDVPDISMRKAMRYLDSCCDAATEGYGYMGPGSTPTTSAVGLLCRQYLQSWGPQNVRLIKGIDNNIKKVEPGKTKNIYYFYYATQVMYHFGGEAWKDWNQKMHDSLLSTQDSEIKSPTFGSWSSQGDPHGSAGGRLMITSLNLLTLEVYYRHLPLYYRDRDFVKEKKQP